MVLDNHATVRSEKCMNFFSDTVRFILEGQSARVMDSEIQKSTSKNVFMFMYALTFKHMFASLCFMVWTGV